MELITTTSVRGAATVLAVSGDIDLQTAPQLGDALRDLAARGGTRIVVDLSEVAFLDSSALGALVAANRDIEERGGTLAVAAPRPHVGKVFTLTRLSDVIPVYATLDEACS